MIMDYRELIAEYADYWRDVMPSDLRRVADFARSDLLHGPVYLDSDNDPCSLYDKGAVAFDFESACAKIRDWCDTMGDALAYVGNEESERVDGSQEAIMETVFGRELARHL